MRTEPGQRSAMVAAARAITGATCRLGRWSLILCALTLLAWSAGRVATREYHRMFSRDSRTELVVMHWSGGGGQQEDEMVETSLREFESANPDLIVRRINAGGAADFYTKLQTMTAGGNPPDVFYVGAERVPAFASLGLLLPLDDLLNRDRATADAPGGSGIDLESFYPTTVSAFRYEPKTSSPGTGPLWGVPKDFTTVGFYLNLDLFRAAGLAVPPDDWTWDDFSRCARAIGELPEADAGCVFVTWPMMVRAYLRTEGVDVLGQSTDALTIEDPAVIAALDRLQGWRHREPKTILRTSANIAEDSIFLGGRIGMAGPFGRWVVPSYRVIPTSGTSSGNARGFDWDFKPLPRGAVSANTIATVSWSIARESAHPEAAWRLIKWLVSPQSQAQQARLGLAIPTIRSVAESDAFCDPEAAPRNHSGFLAPAEKATVVDWPADPQFEGLLGSRLDEALKTGRIPVSAAVGNFLNDWRSVSESPLAKAQGPPVPWTWILTTTALVMVAGVMVLYLRSRSNERRGLMLASPWIIGFCVFMGLPLVISLVLAFSQWSGLSTLDRAEFIGLANFHQLFSDDTRFAASLRVTAYYALLAVPFGQVLALGLALLLHTRVRPQRLFRSALYLPSVLAGVGAAVLWQWVFDYRAGLLNGLLGLVGINGPDWLGSDASLLGPPAFALMSLWYVGGSMMVYLAGLQQVPHELLEASEMDGASSWRKLQSVTLPMLSPVILFNVLMACIASFQVFTQAFIMGGGKSGDSTLFYVLYLYDQGFVNYRMGYASAMAWLLLLAVLAVTGVILRSSARLVYYEGMKT